MYPERSWHFGTALYRKKIQIFPTLSNSLTSAVVNAKELLDIINQHLKDFANYFDYAFLYNEAF